MVRLVAHTAMEIHIRASRCAVLLMLFGLPANLPTRTDVCFSRAMAEGMRSIAHALFTDRAARTARWSGITHRC
jgi:hypothetical protein